MPHTHTHTHTHTHEVLNYHPPLSSSNLGRIARFPAVGARVVKGHCSQGWAFRGGKDVHGEERHVVEQRSVQQHLQEVERRKGEGGKRRKGEWLTLVHMICLRHHTHTHVHTRRTHLHAGPAGGRVRDRGHDGGDVVPDSVLKDRRCPPRRRSIVGGECD